MLRHGTRTDIWSARAKSKGGRPPDLEKREKVRELFRRGFSDREIAVRLGTTREGVRKIRARMGLRRPSTREGYIRYEKKVCPVCGGTFAPLSGAQVYCGPACRRKAGGAVG